MCEIPIVTFWFVNTNIEGITSLAYKINEILKLFIN